MPDWVSTSFPKDLFAEITELVRKTKLWINEVEFIREAVREKLQRERVKHK